MEGKKKELYNSLKGFLNMKWFSEQEQDANSAMQKYYCSQMIKLFSCFNSTQLLTIFFCIFNFDF